MFDPSRDSSRASSQAAGHNRRAQRSRLALTALAAAAGLAVAAAALAQVPPAPGDAYLDAPVTDASAQQIDPSSRIATLTAVDGNLSFAPAGSDNWAATGLNRPITTGDRLWLDAGGRAELHAGTVAIRMGGATAASILNLDDSTTQVKLTQGTLQLRVRALPQDQTVEVDTPNLAFVPREPGDYRLDVAPDGSTTTVTMRHGSAVVYGDSRSIEMQRGDRMRFAGTDLADAGGGGAPEDAFDRWTAARDAREDASPSARYLPREMPGYAALDDYGDWQEDPGYGAVWFPRVVSAGWAPYSVGHWAWIAPWGWTWIDDAPWGFAPSHYGRWAYVGTRWGWVPGPRVGRPCYAPAVVAFVGGGGPHWNVRVGNGPGVAWYPLGPRDAYRPAYRASPTYVARINRVTVNNIVMGDRRPGPYANRNVPGAITGMPARNFVEGRPVRGMHREEWRNLPTGEARGGPLVAPVKSSLLGAAPARPLPPQARHGFERQAIAARPPGRPASDDLARRFAREGAVVPGAGPVWRGERVDRGERGRPGRAEARPAPEVRMSQAAIAARDRGNANAPGEPWRGNGRGASNRPDEARGFAGQPGAPDAQRQAQAMQREQQQALQQQQMEQQRALRDQQRQLPEMQRQQQQEALQRQQRQGQDPQQQARELQRQQQEAMDRRQQEQQRQWQGQAREQQQARELQRQQQEAMDRRQQEQQRVQQRQWPEGQDRPDPARQSQDMQRQRFEQQRQMQEAQQQQRQMQEGQQRQMQEAQQQRQMQEARQRQAQDAQRQQMEPQRQFDAQQRQAADQQRQQMERQRQMAEQQRQGEETQRQRFEQQRQAQEAQQRQAQAQAQAVQRQQMEQQRQVQEQQRQQATQRQMHEQQQRAAQEQQRAMQEQQRQQAMQRQMHEQQQRAAQEQQRAMQEQQRQQAMQRQVHEQQQRAAQEQQRAMQEQQRQQAMQRQMHEQQRAAQEQQRAMQEQQRHQQDQQRQMQERQRQQMEQQRQQQQQQQQQQQRAQHERGQVEARIGRDGDRRQ